MNDCEHMSFAEVQARLVHILGSNCLLYHQLDRALMSGDRTSIRAAMRALSRYPINQRKAIEKLIIDWLFDPQDVKALHSKQAMGRD